MSPTHYQVLNLPPPTHLLDRASTPNNLPSNRPIPPDPATLRKAYRHALLRAHPDKLVVKTSADRPSRETQFSIDAVKEAFAILSCADKKVAYDESLRRNMYSSVSDTTESDGARDTKAYEDFVLGLEILDLSDFEEVDGELSSSSGSASSEEMSGGEWVRLCRCGAEKGFRITEEELEGACGRGEKEVLVGCEGCSLWVRVAFDVEVEGG